MQNIMIYYDNIAFLEEMAIQYWDKQSIYYAYLVEPTNLLLELLTMHALWKLPGNTRFPSTGELFEISYQCLQEYMGS